VAPAAYSLSLINYNHAYYNALKKSSIAILDSGFFCILLRLFRLAKVKKLSGYSFLKNFISSSTVKGSLLLTIDPNKKESKINHLFLKKNKFYRIASYIAPNYSKCNIKNDNKIILMIKKIKPKYILINIGGGKQEVLAEYLYNKINKKISILCLGAAISFFTGCQATISTRVDKYYLGWLARWMHSPLSFFKRILISFTLIKLFF